MTALATASAAVQAAAPADLHLATEILAAAYHAGDLAAWLVPSPTARATIYRRYCEILVEHSLTYGHVDLVDDVAVALWFTQAQARPQQIWDYDRRLAQAAGHRCLPRFVALDTAMAMGVHHPVGRVHRYLAGLAVRPGLQGRGYGGLLLRHQLAILDAASLPSYLAATNVRNLTLFHRYDYVSLPPVDVDGDTGPWIYPMWRDVPSPRPAHHTP